MTYKEKVDWLLSYRRQQQRVEELSREMQEMAQVMQSQREQLAVGRNGDWKRARQQQEAETMQERRLVLASEQRRMTALGDAVEAAIGRLEEPRQRRVLRQIYLAGMSQNQVCEQFHYCKRQVSRSHADGVNAMLLRAEDLQAGERVGKRAKA